MLFKVSLSLLAGRTSCLPWLIGLGWRVVSSKWSYVYQLITAWQDNKVIQIGWSSKTCNYKHFCFPVSHVHMSNSVLFCSSSVNYTISRKCVYFSLKRIILYFLLELWHFVQVSLYLMQLNKMLHSSDLKTMLKMFILNIDFLHSHTTCHYSSHKPGCFNISFSFNKWWAYFYFKIIAITLE